MTKDYGAFTCVLLSSRSYQLDAMLEQSKMKFSTIDIGIKALFCDGLISS